MLKYHILLAIADEQVRTPIEMSIRHAYSVLTIIVVQNSVYAINALSLFPIAAAVAPHTPPVINALELSRTIRQQRPCMPIAVIANSLAIEHVALQAGADIVLHQSVAAHLLPTILMPLFTPLS